MKTLSINLPDGRVSPLHIGSGILPRFSELFDITDVTSVFVLTEPVVKERWIDTLQQGLPNFEIIEIESGESSKNIDTLGSIWQQLLQKKADRNSLIVNLGGGMLTDLGGFAASTYMRGIRCINVPTTLLSQVDASIGGKTGINHGGVKNSVGSFAQPIGVLIDIDTLKTLPERDLAAGFSEIIKHGLIADEGYLKAVSDLDMEHLVLRSCEIKRDIVSRDEREGDQRKLLNFGHTLGHALEGLAQESNDSLLHGEAVSLGMVGEAYLSFCKGYIELSSVEEIERALEKVKLPIRLTKDYSFNALYSLMLRDKKNMADKISWTLLKRVGEGVIDQHVDKSDVEAALKYLAA